MYLFLAVAAIYTYYLFNSSYLKKKSKKDFYNNENEINDTYLDEDIAEDKLEPKEVELVYMETDKNIKKNNKFIEDNDGWSLW